MPRLIGLWLVLVCSAAAAAPARVVLADRDPELRRAIASALAPWKIEVVVDEPAAPADLTHARSRADAAHAQVVVWRARGDLVVYDRARDTTDERPAKAGTLDPVAAATIALSVKTLLRLPPLPPATEAAPASDTGTAAAASPESEPTRAFGITAGAAVRLARGSQTDVGARALLSVWGEPVPTLALRIGVTADLGTASAVNHASFRGSASDWAVIGHVGWAIRRGAWEVVPSLGAGIEHTQLTGTEMSASPRTDTATLATARASVTGLRRWGVWSVGAMIGVETVFGTPTYTRSMGTTIFEVPAFSVVTAVVVGADVGR